MCGPFLEAVKKMARDRDITPVRRRGPTKVSLIPSSKAIGIVHPPGTKRWKMEYFATPKDLGKALNDSVKVHADLHTEHRTESGIVPCNGCCAKPVVLTPNPKDVQREYDSLRVINPRMELIDSEAVDRALERILNMLVRDKLIEMGYKGDEAKVVLSPIEPPYRHRFGTPKEKKAVERRVNAEIENYSKEWRDITIMPPTVTKGDSNESRNPKHNRKK